MKFTEAIPKFNANREFRVNPRCVDGQDRDLRNFAIYMHDCEIEDVDDDQIIEWLNYYRRMGYANGTIIKKEQALIQFFKHFKRKGFEVVDPYLIPLTDKEFIAPKICTDKKYRQLLKAIPNDTTAYYHLRNKAIITLIWNTGIRIGELAMLSVSDLDTERHLIKVKTEKSKGVRPFRVLPYDIFDDKAVDSLKKWMKRRSHLVIDIPLEDPDILFFGVKNGKTRGHRMAINALGEIFRKYSARAGLEAADYVNPHSLRHHYGNELAKRHFNNSIISEAMGHSAISSSYRYTILETGDLVETLKNPRN